MFHLIPPQTPGGGGKRKGKKRGKRGGKGEKDQYFLNLKLVLQTNCSNKTTFLFLEESYSRQPCSCLNKLTTLQ